VSQHGTIEPKDATGIAWVIYCPACKTGLILEFTDDQMPRALQTPVECGACEASFRPADAIKTTVKPD
jgi:hypothetical protein